MTTSIPLHLSIFNYSLCSACSFDYSLNALRSACDLIQSCDCGRSGETRTRGLMVPNHARYQLRYTSIAKLLYALYSHLSIALLDFSA